MFYFTYCFSYMSHLLCFLGFLIKKWSNAWRASIELWMHAGSWESTREAFEWHEAKPNASLASQVLS